MIVKDGAAGAVKQTAGGALHMRMHVASWHRAMGDGIRAIPTHRRGPRKGYSGRGIRRHLIFGVELGLPVTIIAGTLLLGASRPVDAEDARAIRKAAAPLLQLLRRRRLLRPRPLSLPERGTDDQDITADGR